MSSAGNKRPPPDRPWTGGGKDGDFDRIQLSLNPKSSYRIKRVLTHMLRGHVFELITDGIFYAFFKYLQNLKTFTRAKYC